MALNNPEPILDPVRERLSEHVMLAVPTIPPTEVGEDVVLKGALYLARRR